METWRFRLTSSLVWLMGLVVIGRLFYWQVLSADKLQAIAEVQHSSTIELPSQRGRILASDGFPLVGNEPSYLLYAYLPAFEANPNEVGEQLAPLLVGEPEDVGATPSGEVREEMIKTTYNQIKENLIQDDLAWVPIKRAVKEETKKSIEALKIGGLGFESGQSRYYPEASMAAQVTGFVGSDANGTQLGYFGLEGYYDLELKGKSGFIHQEKDALGRPIVVGNFQNIDSRDGRDLLTHIDRGIQYMVERMLKDALERYGAAAGEVMIMDPKTGGILALASLPSFEQKHFKRYEPSLYKLPSVADTYEPGSTFKALVVAAALNEGAIEPDQICQEECRGPVTIGKYTIRTWNNEYHEGQTVTEILEHSDNVGMVWVGQQLGKEKFEEYLDKFGMRERTGIDVEGETVPPTRDRWGDIDLATGSFGQGLAVTSVGMLRAFGAIANGGVLMEPHLVDKVIGDKEVEIKPKEIRRVIEEETAKTISEMLESAVSSGEAQWTQIKGYRVAGKTGTAQIPIAGHYDEEKTIASFVGFAPVDDPKFVMLVKLREPTSSPWAAETAAPLWMNIARELLEKFKVAAEI